MPEFSLKRLCRRRSPEVVRLIRLLLCRHGVSMPDLEPRCIEGSGDFPLTDLGRRQAATLAYNRPPGGESYLDQYRRTAEWYLHVYDSSALDSQTLNDTAHLEGLL